ncbi:LytR/AlgR family response regulator transcription factor [Roseivirga sp. BDSF3-8]|uniref:LytR/AlgR family response regulator transcription factor n=1 Tax=Roseivirga sp. BDSF3-8 TaxID=3241598 RepID=UPI003531DC49
MINVLIIEDEQPAVRHLQKLLERHAPDAEVCGALDTVEGAIKWFKENDSPDLILSDIRLADGLSFDIFKEVQVKAPIIFTTAYDRFAIQAFKLNSVDYLLKPIDGQELEAALDKYRGMKPAKSPAIPDLEQLASSLQQLTRGYKGRFVVRIGERLKAIETTDILYFYSKDKITFMKTADGKRHVTDYTLEQLEQQLDPAEFFRISRQYIIRFEAIEDMVYYSSTKLKLTLNHQEEKDVFVSRQRLHDFKEWLDK